MSKVSSSRLYSLLAVFILSGFAGLIYQSIWSHYLGLFLGHAAYAQALVLAIFMGGMAAGAALVARAGSRWGNLIRRYAVIEAVIGLLAMLFHWVFVGMLGLSYEFIIPALGNASWVNLYKWLLAGLLILPQTLLLGMTFPLMSGGIIRRFPGADGHILGSLYFTNSIGAAIGVLFAAFLILPAMGLQGAMLLAGGLNLLVAALAWTLAGADQSAPTVAEPKTAIAGSGASGVNGRLLRIVLLGTFLSGAASFAYEIIWIRMLSLAVGSTLHAFELMLAAFIAGIAFGGLWVRKRADSARDPLRLVGWLQIAMGLAALVSLIFYANSFGWVGFLMAALTHSDGGYAFFNLGTGLIAVLIMMPAAFFAGTTLPLFTVVLLRDGQGEASIGRVYAWNTLGAILGVFAAIHLLIPVLGLKMALVFSAMVDMVIGLALLRLRTFDSRDFAVFAGAAGCVALAVSLIVSQVPFDPLRLSSGVYRSGQASLAKDTEIAFYQDGKTASVAATNHNSIGVAAIATNGKVDAAIRMGEGDATSDEPTMVLAAAIPMAYVSDLKSAGVIGFGSGLTTHTLLADRRVQRVDTIEIEAQMVAGAQIFGHRVARAYSDPRSNIIIDDAKSYFAGQQHRYDLIVSEPSNPWISGVGALFSREFYEFVPQFLSDDGVFVQWLQLYEIDEKLVGSVLNALAPAFQDYHAYLSNSADLLIVASNKPLSEQPDFQKLFSGELKGDLQAVGMSHPDQLRFRKVADAQMIRALARLYAGPVNSDYYPVLSLNAPRTRFKKQSADQLMGIPVASLPLLESLGVSGVLGASADIGFVGHYRRADFTGQARAARAALMGDGADIAYRQTVESMWEIKGVAECAQPWTPVREELAVKHFRVLVEATLAYMGPEELEGVLIDPSWQSCNNLPAAYTDLLNIVRSAALRDDARFVELAAEWFESVDSRPKIYSDEFDKVVFGLWQLALIKLERYDEAKQLESVHGAQVPASGYYGFIRSLLLAWLDVHNDQEPDGLMSN
ncbi:fused MFS/spermidine synthase [Ectopseudomonas alcaliphila]|uniref:Fused MFS/spermidine synthase n=1 Tax=Ectopseudomonas alcaliphila TaxID=101564 RepID=A0A1G6XGN6_9GAMM|nr:fused MFS/spermidine synthase [Pseudomonas alcaliphila]MDX5992292.1 fused MFS/spermidine synthase [Pseudomonas alcaliphila]SDD77378.1 Spermine/spermidine synthase [Pseudomonas alcaliphila]